MPHVTAGVLWLLLGGGCSSETVAPPASEIEPPNRVVLVTIDTLRADHLHSYGYAREMSPFIDRLAREGVQFTNVITHMPTTAPSHASIFTSLYPFQHGLTTNYSPLDPALLTLAEAFQENGFQTAGFSSITFLKNLRRGFEFFEFLDPKEKKPGTDKKKPNRKANETVDLAIQWIQDKQPADRFFMWIHIFDVHQWLFARDSEPAYVEKAGFSSEAERREWRRFLSQEHNIPRILKAEPRAEAILRYDSQLLFADEHLERFFEAMESRGLNGNHDEVYHTPHLYEEQLRVPLIFFAPGGGLPQRQVHTLARLVDLFPTIAEIAKLELDSRAERFSGRSLVPAIQGSEESTVQRYAFSERHPKDNLNRNLSEGDVYSLRSLDFKYIYHSEGPSEFYDLKQDPFELDNRIDEPSEDKERIAKLLEVRFRPLMQPAEIPSSAELDQDTLEELKALGYVQ
jgi:arylsulfatase A-like enzyme